MFAAVLLHMGKWFLLLVYREKEELVMILIICNREKFDRRRIFNTGYISSVAVQLNLCQTR